MSPEKKDAPTNIAVGLILVRYRVLWKVITDHLMAFSDHFEQHLKETKTNLDDPYNIELGLAGSIDMQEFRTAIDHFFPQTLRAALFVSTYAELEYYFVRLCREVQDVGNYRLQVADVQGKGIEQAHTYLTKVVGLKVTGKVWEKVRFLRNIRNIIVHSGREIVPDTKLHRIILAQLGKWKLQSLELSESGSLTFRARFNREAASDVFSVFKDLVVQNTIIND